MMMKQIAIITAAGIVLSAAGAAAQPTNSIFLRADQEARMRSLRGFASADAAGVETTEGVFASSAPSGGERVLSVQNASWTSVSKPRQKDFRVHDLVTIVVHEVSKHRSTTKTDAEREYSLDAQLQDWIRLTGGNLRPDPQPYGDPKIGLSFDRDFRSKGKVEREDTVTARIHAEVIDVLPNGNLLLEARHQVVTDEEEMIITLTGICRGKDVGMDNSVLSTQLARLDLRKHHKGIARDTSKRGWLAKIVDFITPF